MPFFRSFLLLSMQITIVWALFNVTVDDQTGDALTGNIPVYTPSGSDGGWVQGSTCSSCPVQPDPSKAFNGTWHYAQFQSVNAFPRSVTISFTGTAVYAYFICANKIQNATTLTNVTFAINGARDGTFAHSPSANADYDYNVLGYSNKNLSKGNHQLVIQNNGDQASIIMFDYLIYSTNQSTNTDSSAGGKTGAIVGGVVGAVAVLAGIGFFCWRRKRTRRRRATINLDEGSVDHSSQHGVDHLTVPVPYPATDLNESSGHARSEMSETGTSIAGALSSPSVRSSHGRENLSGGRGEVSEANAGIMRKRRADIDRQVEEMQRRVALLRSQSNAAGGLSVSRAGTAGASNSGSTPSGSATGSSDNEAAELRSHVANLEAEVVRLQAQQEYYQQMGLGDEPPPQYAESVDPNMISGQVPPSHP